MRRSATLWSLPLFVGCASVIAPGPDKVPITTVPAGARVLLDGADVGRTPMVLAIPRKVCDGHVVRLEADGVPPREIQVGVVMNGWTWLNVPFLNLIGVWLDFATGNNVKVRSSERIDEDLTRPSTRPTPASRSAERSDG